jgi:hypothetical protein
MMGSWHRHAKRKAMLQGKVILLLVIDRRFPEN